MACKNLRQIFRLVNHLLIAAFLITATVGCGNKRNPTIDNFLNSLSITQGKLQHAVIASTEEEYRSAQDLRVSRYSLVWSFKPNNELRKFVYVHPTIAEWEALESLTPEMNLKDERTFRYFQNGSRIIFNSVYSARLTETPLSPPAQISPIKIKKGCIFRLM